MLRLLRKKTQRKNLSASLIASVFRGHISRRNLKQQRINQNAACQIQAFFRANLVRIKLQDMKVASIKLQSFMRMTNKRSQYILWNKKATVLQTYQRRHSKLQIYSAMRHQVIQMQKLFRVRRRVLMQRCQSILNIQRVCRGFLDRKLHYEIVQKVKNISQMIWLRQRLPEAIKVNLFAPDLKYLLLVLKFQAHHLQILILHRFT